MEPVAGAARHAGVDAALAVADAIMYEGYLLYPYRRSAGKNRVRWQFGVLAPPAWARAHGLVDELVAGSAESWWQQTECLVEPADGMSVRVRVRFLQLQRRTVQRRLPDGGYEPVDELSADGRTEFSFDEAVPEEYDIDVPADGECVTPLAVPGGWAAHSLDGAGRIVRERWPVQLRVTASMSRCAAPFRLARLRLRIENTDVSTPPDASREDALRRSLIATHSLITVDGGRFVSLLDPPAWAAAAVGSCRNVHTFPVLAGEPATEDVVLSSPIILYDHPRVAPESPGDLHDATEIDEILSLRTLTLTDAEKREARATDPRAAAILDRVETMPPAVLAGLHGTIRERGPEGETVVVAGTRLGAGSRLRLRPRKRGTDAHDLFLDGRTARVEEVLVDVDGSRFLAVTVDDDPGAELHQWYGRLRHFRPDEVEPLDASQ